MITQAALLLGKDNLYIATDLNDAACSATRATASINNALVCPIHTSFCDGLRLTDSVHILMFNPPYVVTSSDELHDAKGVALSWAGGVNGREVIDKLIDSGTVQVKKSLTNSNVLSRKF